MGNDLIKFRYTAIPTDWTCSKKELMESGLYFETNGKEEVLPRLGYYMFQIMCKYEYEEDFYEEDKNKIDLWYNIRNKKDKTVYKRKRYSDEIRFNSDGHINSAYNPIKGEYSRISSHYGNPLTFPMIQESVRTIYERSYGDKPLIKYSNFKARVDQLRGCEREISVNWFRVPGFPDTFWTLADDGYGNKGKYADSYWFDTLENVIQRYSEFQLRMFYNMYPAFSNVKPSSLVYHEGGIAKEKYFLPEEIINNIQEIIKQMEKDGKKIEINQESPKVK